MKSLTLKQAAQIDSAAQEIRARLGDFQPDIALILGSGLGGVASIVTDPIQIPYGELTGFPSLSVEGHAGCLVFGSLGRRKVAIMQGRIHTYETELADSMALPVSVLHQIGCKDLIVTNSAGSLRKEVSPGQVMMISDHINLTGRNPLFGAHGNDRFVDMVNAYDKDWRVQFQTFAKDHNVSLAEGVYMWFVGPSFETPAEIRAAKILGADAVGMSTVPEVIVARAFGMRVAAFSLITNLGAGMGTENLSHAQTLSRAADGATSLKKLLLAYMETDT